MKRLFECGDFYFDKKENAKAYRDEYPGAKLTVKLGPDHWRYGLKGKPRTHSHNARSGGSNNGFKKGK